MASRPGAGAAALLYTRNIMGKKLLAAALALTAGLSGSCATTPSGKPVRGPAGPDVALDCSHQEEALDVSVDWVAYDTTAGAS